MEKDISVEDVVEIIFNAVIESIDELAIKHLTEARVVGQTNIHIHITLAELMNLVKNRLEELDGWEMGPDHFLFSEWFQDHWLPEIIYHAGYSFDNDGNIEFDSEVPPPRLMHAR